MGHTFALISRWIILTQNILSILHILHILYSTGIKRNPLHERKEYYKMHKNFEEQDPILLVLAGNVAIMEVVIGNIVGSAGENR